jgi:hypothetical protein
MLVLLAWRHPISLDSLFVGGLKWAVSGIVKSNVGYSQHSGKQAGCDQSRASPAWVGQTCGFVPALFGTVIVACHSPSSQPSDNLNELLPLPETMLDLVLLGLIPAAEFGEELHRAKLVRSSILPLFAS